MRDGRSITDRRVVPGLEALIAQQSVTSKQEFSGRWRYSTVRESSNVKVQPSNLIVAVRLSQLAASRAQAEGKQGAPL